MVILDVKFRDWGLDGMVRVRIIVHSVLCSILLLCRCSLDGEWATETRHNGGPGKKKGRMAVVSICYLAPDTPTGLSTAFDLLPWCRVGVFQVFDLAQLPISLKDLIETKSVVKTGKVCIHNIC